MLVTMDGPSASDDTLSDLMSSLSNETRRRILAALRGTEPGVGVSQEHLVSRATTRDGVVIQHVHLPLLEDEAIVEWDRDDGVVYRGDRFDVADELLQAIEPTGSD